MSSFHFLVRTPLSPTPTTQVNKPKTQYLPCVESVSNGVNSENTKINRKVNKVTPVPIVCAKAEQTMAEMLENPGAQELVQENQTAVEQPEAEGGGNKNRGDIRKETKYGYETELDYMDSSIPDDGNDSTLKDQDISDDEEDDERDLEEKCANKMQEMQIANEENEQEMHISQQEPQGGRKLRERKTRPGDYKKTHTDKQDTTTKQTKTLPNVEKYQHEHQKPKKVTKTKHLQAIKAVLQRRHLIQTQMQTKKSKISENKSTDSKGHQRKKKWKITNWTKSSRNETKKSKPWNKTKTVKEKELTETKEKLLQILLKEGGKQKHRNRKCGKWARWRNRKNNHDHCRVLKQWQNATRHKVNPEQLEHNKINHHDIRRHKIVGYTGTRGGTKWKHSDYPRRNQRHQARKKSQDHPRKHKKSCNHCRRERSKMPHHATPPPPPPPPCTQTMKMQGR